MGHRDFCYGAASQPKGNSAMSRAAHFCFATVAYAIFFATFLYLIAFVGNLPFAALTVDRGPDAPVATAVVVNLALIALFGIQHSVMARQGFKAPGPGSSPTSWSAASMCSPPAPC